jgi:glycyl-tRNA synthetase beta chain
MKGEFFLEIGTEEIPAGFIGPATGSLSDLFTRALKSARVAHGRIETYATPRRLVLCASDVAARQESVEVEKTGPPTASAFDEQGNPTKAAIGFARSQGVEVADLVTVKTSKGEQVAVRKIEEGQSTIQALVDILPGLLERISFPKTMRWMDLDVRFARPIHWIVALFEGEVVPFSFGNVSSGDVSHGHRFKNPATFRVTGLKDLRKSLEKQEVVLDQAERRSQPMCASRVGGKRGLRSSTIQSFWTRSIFWWRACTRSWESFQRISWNSRHRS